MKILKRTSAYILVVGALALPRGLYEALLLIDPPIQLRDLTTVLVDEDHFRLHGLSGRPGPLGLFHQGLRLLQLPLQLGRHLSVEGLDLLLKLGDLSGPQTLVGLLGGLQADQPLKPELSVGELVVDGVHLPGKLLAVGGQLSDGVVHFLLVFEVAGTDRAGGAGAAVSARLWARL